MKRMYPILIAIALMGLIASVAVAQGQPGQGKGRRFGAQLTAEQREQVQAKVKEMKAAGAQPEEIRAALQELCKGWGIEPRQGKGLGQRFGANLTEEQRTQLQVKIKEMRAAGANPEEIRAAVQELLKGWGVEPPQGGPGKGPGHGVGANLTEEQRTQLQAKVKEMRDAGAKPEEIKAAVQELLKGWGIEPPQGKGPGQRFGANLTEEQRAQLQAKVKELKDAGAKPEEIKAAVHELLKGWGVQPPQRERGGGMRGLLQDLTDEQRQQVLGKIDEMQKAGSTREEIKRTITNMIQGFGDKA